MRALLAVLLATTALPSWADIISAESRITAVTVYPDGARLTREVRFQLPSGGSHDLVITGLPVESASGLVRLAPGEGLGLGAFTLRSDRLPAREPPLTAAQEAAQAEVDRLEDAEQTASLALAAVQARVEAAEAQVRFLSSFTGALPDGATPDAIRSMAAMIAAETLAARTAALAAEAELFPARKALVAAQEDLAMARDAYAALPAAAGDFAALAVTVTGEAAGERTLTVTQYIGGASWRPVYDLNLVRDGEDALVVNRSVLVTQVTGEDWAGVDLTLSSSRPSEQAAPSVLWPELRRIAPEGQVPEMMRSEDIAGAAFDTAVVAEAEPEMIVAGAAMEGDTVVYVYPAAVTVASGVEDLRLSLDELTFAPVVEAVAVPRLDRTAFVSARFTNGSGEPLLPGEAMLFREGVLVGSTWLEVIAPGVETEVAFGALETLRVTREMPNRAEGETGVFSTSNELREQAVITVENTSGEAWPVRVLDQVPYSEQQDLEIDISASPEPTETDVEGQRGILAWEFDLPAGGKETITLDHILSWPEGMVLQ